MTTTASSGKTPLTLLLVEDDDGDAECVGHAFAQAGSDIRIVRATDGLDALAILRDRKAASLLGPRCVLLVDVNMPRMGGIELVAELRHDPDWRRAVVFMLTTSIRSSDQLAAYEQQVAGYIVKETDGRELPGLLALMDCYRDLIKLPPPP